MSNKKPTKTCIELSGGILCFVCKDVFLTKQKFDLHFNNKHTGQKIKYTCTKCTKWYENIDAFRPHCYRHIHSQLPYVCPECRKHYAQIHSLAMHIRDQHFNLDDTRNNFMCPFCDEKFTRIRDWLEHNNKYLKLTSYKCNVCSKECKDQTFLYSHMQFHSKTRRFKCDECSKSFKTPKCLSVHSRVHEPSNYVCELCGKSLYNKYKLRQHMFTHTGERPYLCKYCPKTFTNFSNWQKHIKRVHKCDTKTGEPLSQDDLLKLKVRWKPKKISNASTSQNQEVNNVKLVDVDTDVMKIIQEMCFQCKICFKYYKTEYCLEMHMVADHEDKIGEYVTIDSQSEVRDLQHITSGDDGEIVLLDDGLGLNDYIIYDPSDIFKKCSNSNGPSTIDTAKIKVQPIEDVKNRTLLNLSNADNYLESNNDVIVHYLIDNNHFEADISFSDNITTIDDNDVKFL